MYTINMYTTKCIRLNQWCLTLSCQALSHIRHFHSCHGNHTQCVCGVGSEECTAICDVDHMADAIGFVCYSHSDKLCCDLVFHMIPLVPAFDVMLLDLSEHLYLLQQSEAPMEKILTKTEAIRNNGHMY